MSLTPLDIQKKTFTRVFRGFDEAEVESFLEEVSTQYLKTIKEISELKDRLRNFQLRIEEFSNREKTVNETLSVVRRLSDEMKENAKKQGDTILNEAKNKARELLIGFKEEIKKLKTEISHLKLRKIEAKNTLIQYLKTQLSLLENTDIEESSEVNDLNSNKDYSESDPQVFSMTRQNEIQKDC